ncbi:MAG: histidine phosphatase family protein [Actinomycetota bacterium]
MATVLGIRHAEVENPDHVVYARSRGFPLAAGGREAARRLGNALRSAAIVAVWASPLDRAVETARELAAPHGLPIRVDDRLTEWGGLIPWQGRPWGEAMADPGLLSMYANPVSSPDDPLDEAGSRVLAWTEEAAAVQAEGVALGVSHEAPLIAAYLAGRGGDYSAFRMVNIPHLGGVRLLPGPPELVDPAHALAPSC